MAFSLHVCHRYQNIMDTMSVSRCVDLISNHIIQKDIFFRKQKSFVVDPTVFICISMLAKAIGGGLAGDIKELLEHMLAVGLR